MTCYFCDSPMHKQTLLLIIIFTHFPSFRCTPHEVEDRLCPGTLSYVRDNSYVFASFGMRCSPENDAYVIGTIFQKFATDGAKFEMSTLNERWEKVAYLDASPYDSLPDTPPPPPGAENCIFNQRLARIQQATGPKLLVATSCNPFELMTCRLEYDNAQLLKEHCDCNYHYSVKVKDSSGKMVCRAKAGVPCKFTTGLLGDPFLDPKSSIECEKSLVCKEESNAGKRNEIFSTSFHGFGFSVVAREFMVANAVGYCSCKDGNQKVNVMNECVTATSWIRKPDAFILILITMIVKVVA
ncbi:hypothetical protein Ocin01_09989 [Orchesella cincta]|uniref:Uncharacterized protein n=1 Tax=Orchesella cincta TaxID=48709 RepID=A0A1D2MVH3_ORCCI|nr:hypothetical protein Ocin01_09989 [Orchesella cincta]